MPRSPNACSCRFLRISTESHRQQALDARAPPAVRSLHLPGLRLSRVLPTRGAHREGRMRNSASADRRQGEGYHRSKAPLFGTGIVSRVGREAQGTWPFAGCRPSWGECSSASRRSASLRPRSAWLTVLTPIPRSPAEQLRGDRPGVRRRPKENVSTGRSVRPQTPANPGIGAALSAQV